MYSLSKEDVAGFEPLRFQPPLPPVGISPQSGNFHFAIRPQHDIRVSLTEVFEMEYSVPEDVFPSFPITIKILLVLKTLQQSLLKSIIQVACATIVSCESVSINDDNFLALLFD